MRSTASTKWIRRAARSPATYLLLAAGIVVIGLMGRTSGDIRLDTGDLRYRWLGVPLVVDRMPEPQRSSLQRLARDVPEMSPRWVQCVRYPLPTSNNTDAMCQSFYMKIAAFADADPELAKALGRSVAEYVSRTRAREGLPTAVHLLRYAKFDGSSWSVDEAWRNDPWAEEVLRELGLDPHAVLAPEDATGAGGSR